MFLQLSQKNKATGYSQTIPLSFEVFFKKNVYGKVFNFPTYRVDESPEDDYCEYDEEPCPA